MIFFDMKKELTFALNYALNKGFQIHPDAFKILENLDVKKLEKIIKEIVREKTKQKLFQINQDDLETYLGIKEDPTLQSEVKVLSDPTTKITTGEGVKGYNALFSSRFNKLKRIISDRPESRMLKSIASVKTTKPESDMYLCGLVTSRTTERNITKLELEDPSGLFEGIVFDNFCQTFQIRPATNQKLMHMLSFFQIYILEVNTSWRMNLQSLFPGYQVQIQLQEKFVLSYS
jgi:DNA polymerase II small subunit